MARKDSVAVFGVALKRKIIMSIAAAIICAMTSTHAYITRIEQCEPIEIPRCRAMPYNMTQMPNLMHHNTQENARLVFEKFEILLDQQCSDALLFLLCSLFVPICAVSLQPEAIPPCRSVCEKARAGCEPLMNSYNVSWPDSLECSRLPSYERGVCVSPDAFVKPSKKKGCKCKRKRPSRRLFWKHKYDYAMRAQVMRKKSISDKEIIYKVKITQILFCGKVKFPHNNEVILWVNSQCACPKMRKGRDYLILGHEDRLGNKLLLDENSIAVKWRDAWPVKLRRWRERMLRKASKKKFFNRSRKGKNRSSKRRRKGRRRQKKRRKQKSDSKSGTTTRRPFSRTPEGTPGTNFEDIVNGYTHGGRYYTKELIKKYNLAALRPAAD